MFEIFLGIGLLVVLAYKGYSTIWIAPICSLVVAALGGLELLPSYTNTYMDGFVGFTKSWFPAFMLGSIFGKIMEDTGYAKSIASNLTGLIGKKRAILAIIIGCNVLTYGGISLFVVVFSMYPLAIAMFREANVSRKLIPACIAFGSFSYTMTAVPGTPQIQNLIPMKYFGTTPMAAPTLGIIAAIFMFTAGYAYLNWKQNRLASAGDVFTEPPHEIIAEDRSILPSPYLAILPLITVIVTLNILPFKEHNIVVALVIGILLAMALNFKYYAKFTDMITTGANSSVLAIINTSAAVGFGAVVKEVPGFQDLVNAALSIEGNPLISEAVAINILAGATGSASGGMGIALEALGSKYMEIAATTGISPEVFHRVASISSGGLDTLPHNGTILTILAISHLTHKESFLDCFITCAIIPIITTFFIIFVASFGIV